MNTDVRTVVVVHAAAEWQTFHRRAMLFALAGTLPPTVALLCVNRPISFDVTPWKHPRKFWSHVWSTDLRADGERIIAVTPRLLLHELVACQVPGALPLNRYLMRAQVGRALARGFPNAQRIIQWIYYPEQRWVWRIFPGSGKVYECYDDYARSSRGEFDSAKWETERRLVQEADLTFVTARSLMEARVAAGGNVEYLPNGVPDFFFECGEERATDPIDIVPHPRIGYLGNIFSILDFELLEQICRVNPQWHLVLVGPIEKGVPIGKLRTLPNAHFIGPRPHRRVPAILRQMDVGLIPFVINDFTRAINPLKVYEYLATGLPVVATRLPELERFQRVVRLADNDAVEFSRAIEETLSGDQSSLHSEAVAAARPFSWTNIARQSVMPVLRETFGIRYEDS